MLSISIATLLLFRLAASQNDGTVGFCTDAACSNCPNSITTLGTGYPNCVVYNSDDVFGTDAPYEPNPAGGWQPFVNVGEPESGCRVIIKSPAGTDLPGCGQVYGSYGNPICDKVPLRTTFMVQYCCGAEDCANSGGTKRGVNAARGLYLRNSTGHIIQPKEVGPPPALERISEKRDSISARRSRARKAEIQAPGLTKRDCSSMKWVVSSDNNVSPNGQDGYTRPADNTQVVYTGATSGQEVTIMNERSTSFSYGAMAGISLDIFNAGVSFTYEESTSSSISVTFPVPEGEMGNIGFTAFWRCTMGQLICNDDGSILQDTSEACTGSHKYNNVNEDVDGSYALIRTS